jgi:magnesium transporter
MRELRGHFALMHLPGTAPRLLSDDELAAIDRLRQRDGALIWMDIADPDARQLELLRQEFALHPLAEEDIRKRKQRPKVDLYGEQLVVVAYEVRDAARVSGHHRRRRGAAQEGEPPLGELHLFLGPGYLVSVHWGSSPTIKDVRHRFENQAETVGKSAGSLLYTILDAVVDGYFPLLDTLSERIDSLEDAIVAGTQERTTVPQLLDVKRELLELRRILAPQRDVANTLLRRESDLISETAVPYYQDLYDHLVRVLDQLDLYRDLVAAVLEANLSVISNNLNAVMKRLTAFTVVLMVPTLIAGIYGMNFHVMPELSWPFGYPLALAVMLLLMAGIAGYFWRKDWF